MNPEQKAFRALQWGRDLSVAEGRRFSRAGYRRHQLQWGRDLSVAEGPPACRATTAGAISFNGAATFRSRKGRRGRHGVGRVEPLQWGRDLSVAEGALPPGMPAAALSFNGAATFRSRKVRAKGLAMEIHCASMGPRPFGRGRIAKASIPI